MRRALLVLTLPLLACNASGSAPATSPTRPEVTPDPASAVATKGAVTKHKFHSPALGVDKGYYLYLPADYGADPSRRFPVIYMLHGLGGAESDWAKHMGLPEAADAIGLEAIVVMPDGDDSFYLNWPEAVDYQSCLQGHRSFGKAPNMATYCVKTPRYEDYIATDLVAHVDASYRTVASRQARAIGGLSMGGYGALMIAMRHKQVFSSVASHSGVDALLYKGPFPYERGKVEIADDLTPWLDDKTAFGPLFGQVLGTDISHWREVDPALLAQTLDDGELDIYFDCGTDDEFRLQNGASYLDEVLSARGVAHHFELLPGHHAPAFWRERIDDSLRFHVAHFQSALASRATGARATASRSASAKAAP